MQITPELFQAYLKCPMKCWLRAAGEVSTGNAYAEWVKSQDQSYHATGAARLVGALPNGDVAICPDSGNLKSVRWKLATNVAVQAQVNSCSVASHLHAVERIPSEGRGKAAQFIPIRFIFRNKLTKDDKLMMAFDALVLSELLGREIAIGQIIHGDDRHCPRSSRGNEAQTEESEIANLKSEMSQSLLTSAATRNGVEEPQTGISATLCPAQPRVTKVKTSALFGEVRKRIEKIAGLLSNPAPPDLVLNRHCGECEFRDRCRKIAIEKDDLSLLAGMNAKERQKLRSKGIFTVTQLSYTFRPRRRPKRLRDKREKYHHALKALAIREQTIHIVGSPELKIEGTPVYLDVEGLPDRDFYYLIGLRIGHGGSAVQHSLWADTVADEGKIWREFLAILETIEKPVLIHYGSYETNFMKQMKDRYSSLPEDSLVAKAMDSSINLVSVMFAQIYFPTSSNGLKDVAAFLGYRWNHGIPSGLDSIVWRLRWEQSSDADHRRRLLAYNAQDCEALSVAATSVRALVSCAEPSENLRSQATDVVRADSAGLPVKSKWRTFKSPVTGFEVMNAAAHWDYQRSRVYARNGKRPRKPLPRSGRQKKAKRTDQVIIWPVARCCPKCNRQVRLKGPLVCRTVQDIIFGRHSLKRRVVKYVIQTYRCWKCRTVFGIEARFGVFRKYGWNFVAYLFYQIVELGVPQITVARNFNRLFGFDLSHSTLNNCKVRFGRYYAETKSKILENIVSGKLVHADETRANIKGTAGFIWVLTSMREVVYVLADSREGEIVQKLLSGFTGVLVTDFYTAYDSLGCPQQRCLIHLRRDLNDEVLGNPFDEQLKQVVASFANVLKPMIETVDRRGLKKYFLRKHFKAVERFYRALDQADYQSEAALKCKERFERNRDKLFTFLDYDGVPWNNNNAEHAIKAFARLRDVIAGSSTAKGIEEYLTLLSVCQTCKYMGVDFLDFLRSGEKDIHAFAESRRSRRKLSVNSESADSVSGTPSSESQPF
ncbi:MAG: IS66 family transposase [Verrucomicrobia bacterium]|nr:IS66 family transposase [Verrucomicrobiota bacterium]